MTTNEQQPVHGKLTAVKADISSLTDRIQKTHEKESEQLKKKVEQTVESIRSKGDEAGKTRPPNKSLEILSSM